MLKFSDIFSNLSLATIVMAGLMASFKADAAIEAETLSTAYLLAQTDYSAGLEVAQFDATLGQLQSVNISATGTGSFSQFYQNLSTSSSDLFTISQTLAIILSLPSSGATLLNFNLSPGDQTYSAQKYVMGSPFLSSPSGGMANYTVAGSAFATLTDSSPVFSQFTGSGLINFLLIASGSSSVAETNGNYFAGGQSLAGLDLTVTYNYTSVAVPEPLIWSWMTGVFAVAGAFICLGKRRAVKA